MCFDTIVACSVRGDIEYRRLEGIFVNVWWVSQMPDLVGSSTKGNFGRGEGGTKVQFRRQ